MTNAWGLSRHQACLWGAHTAVCGLFLIASCVSAGTPPASIDLSGDVPDLCQTDPDGRFPGNGRDLCGPVAVANSLMYLTNHGFPRLRTPAATDKEAQIALVHRLAAGGSMDTVERNGTSPPRLMAGVGAFVAQAGYQVVRLEQQGWRGGTKQFPALCEIPCIDWIKEGLSTPGGAVWLNVGWYRAPAGTNEYRRFAGHWVTVVGYGKDQRGAADPLMLLIHDPAPRTGTTPHTQWVKLSVIDQGTLQRDLSPGRIHRREAKGFFEMKGEMKLKSGADAAILDVAVVLVIRS